MELRVNLDGIIFEGNPTAIVRAIKEGGIDFSQTETLDDYMIWLSKNIFKMCGVGVQIPNGSTDEKAAALVEQLISAGMVQKIECPQCKNEEIAENDSYCKICGLRLER